MAAVTTLREYCKWFGVEYEYCNVEGAVGGSGFWSDRKVGLICFRARERWGVCRDGEMTQMEKIRPYICFEIRSRSFRGIHRSAPWNWPWNQMKKCNRVEWTLYPGEITICYTASMAFLPQKKWQKHLVFRYTMEKSFFYPCKTSILRTLIIEVIMWILKKDNFYVILLFKAFIFLTFF